MERAKNQRAANLGYAVLGLALFFVAWQWAGKAEIAGPVMPALSDVAATLFQPETCLCSAAPLSTRSASAAKGLFFGGSLAVLLAVAMRLLPPLRPGLDRLAILVNATPPIAIGPDPYCRVQSGANTSAAGRHPSVFSFLRCGRVGTGCSLSGAAPGDDRLWSQQRETAASSGAARGLATPCQRTEGGGVRVVHWRHSGEWFGAPQGLGLVILNAMQNFQIPLMWAAVTVAAALSLAAFLIAAGI